MTEIPTQVANILHAPEQAPLRIIQIVVMASGALFGLDQEGNTYIAVKSQIMENRFTWQLIISKEL